jgi:hypothetical protein
MTSLVDGGVSPNSVAASVIAFRTPSFSDVTRKPINHN